MQTSDRLTRQGIGCGYEPPAPPSLDVDVWDPPARDPDGDDPARTCPGYVCSLPQVLEASYLRMHWKQGELRSACGGRPHEQVMHAITELEAASNQCERWSINNPSKAGE